MGIIIEQRRKSSYFLTDKKQKGAYLTHVYFWLNSFGILITPIF